MVCYVLLVSRIQIEGDQTFFLPTGIQEKGFCGAVSRSGGTGNPSTIIGTPINFKKVMVNTPSSITFTVVATSNVTGGPSADYISRFGFIFVIANSAASQYSWWGAYTTVGN